MGLSNVNSAGEHEGELKGELFAGDHRPDGVFESLKGRMLEPWELSYYEQPDNDGPDRLNQEVTKEDWESSTLVQSGEFDPNRLTRGTDKHMPR